MHAMEEIEATEPRWMVLKVASPGTRHLKPKSSKAEIGSFGDSDVCLNLTDSLQTRKATCQRRSHSGDLLARGSKLVLFAD